MDTKAIVTRGNSRVEFDDAKKIVSVTTPGGNTLVLSDDGKSVVLSDQNHNRVVRRQTRRRAERPDIVQIHVCLAGNDNGIRGRSFGRSCEAEDG